MASFGSGSSSRTNQSFSGSDELPPKKRALDRGKAVLVLDESPKKNNLEIDLNRSQCPSIPFGMGEIAPAKLETVLPSQEPQKPLPDQAPQKAETKSENQQSDKPLSLFLHLKKGEKGASSTNPQPLPIPPPSSPKNDIVCKFCGQKFSTSQALGGHQNAHKQEREMQRAMKAAQQSSFGSHMPNTRMAPLFHGSHYGHPSLYNPYQGYAPGGWQRRPVNPNPRIGLVQGSPAFAQGLVHYQPTLAQGHVQPRVAQGLVQGRPGFVQGLVHSQPNLAQGLVHCQPSFARAVVHGQPNFAHGVIHGQPNYAQGPVLGQPNNAQGIVHGQPSHAQGAVHGQPSHAQSLVPGQPSHARSLEGYIGNSSMNPTSLAYNFGWPTPYVGPSGFVRADSSTNLNHVGTSNMTSFTAARENEGNLPKRQCLGSTDPGLSLNGSQSAEVDSLKDPHEPDKLDLNLKL